MNYLIILVTLGIIGLGYLLWKHKKKDYIMYQGVKVPKTFAKSYTTPMGVSVHSVVEVPVEALNAIDAGISRQLECINHAKPNWTGYNSHNFYTVKLLDPMIISPEMHLPSLIVSGIMTAGTCMGVGNDGQVEIVILLPHQANQNWNLIDYFKNSARNESEHVREWVNDTEVFWSFVGAGDIHPHFPCPGEV